LFSDQHRADALGCAGDPIFHGNPGITPKAIPEAIEQAYASTL
jgi:hypothetical protein